MSTPNPSTLALLDDYGFLCLEGKDVVKFLQGYATCDLGALDTGRALPGALCDIKGRMLASFLILRLGDQLLLRMHKPLVAETIKFLAKYIVFYKTTMTDVSDSWHCYGAWDAADPALRHAKEADQLGFTVVQAAEQVSIALGFGEEVWSKAPLAAEASALAWRDLEVAAGLAWVQQATSGVFLPQMFNYHTLGAIDFAKGCYLGQEVVARAQYRGQLKRRLHSIKPRNEEDSLSIKVGDQFDGGMIVAVGKRAALAVISHGGPNSAEGSEVSISLQGQPALALLL